MKTLVEIYNDIESKRLLKYEEENNNELMLYEQQEKQRFEYVKERERMYQKLGVYAGGRGKKNFSISGYVDEYIDDYFV
jgi:hypothetical protein